MKLIIKVILQFLIGLTLAWGFSFLSWPLGVFCARLYSKAFFPPCPSPLGYVDFMAGIAFILTMFIGIPIGAIIGVYSIDRLFTKRIILYKQKIIAGFITGILGTLFVCIVFPLLDIDTALFYKIFFSLGIYTEGWLRTVETCPVYIFISRGGYEAFFLIATLFAVTGYNIVSLFHRKNDLTIQLKYK
jgi:hypothetical protein